MWDCECTNDKVRVRCGWESATIWERLAHFELLNC